MTLDPVATNPDHYSVIFENDQVRVLEYLDQPGDRTTPHEHPNSVMVTLSSFRRRLAGPGRQGCGRKAARAQRRVLRLMAETPR